MPDSVSVAMSRQVVGLQERGREQSHGHPSPEREPPVEAVGEEAAGQRDDERGVLHIGGARRGDEAKEDEDEQFPEAEVPVGAGATRVGPPRDAAHQTERDEPPRDAGRQPEARCSGNPEGDERSELDLPHRGELAGHEPDRADPVLIRPANPVRIVVDVVRADLDPQRHDQRQDGVQPVELTVEGCTRSRVAGTGSLWCRDENVTAREVTRCRTHHDGDDRGRECAWARAGHPRLDRRVHGRRGNREKSGARCSTKAFRPSCPSSVM